MSQLDFIEKQKLLYKSLKPCYCEAIKETVFFTSDGLNHLLYHRRRPRNINERVYRAALISYICEVIMNATTAVKTLDASFGSDPLWILEHEVSVKHKGKRQIIKVILQKKGAGNTHFLSAMSRTKFTK
jgi:hypothetical protein